MTIKDLKPGTSIRPKNQYKGGGEFIVSEIKKGYVWMICALNTRFPRANGSVSGEPVEIVLEFYEIVKD